MSGEPDTTEQTVGSPDRVVTDEQRAYWAQVEAPMASCTALITDADGRILVVDPTYKDGFDMPGGMVEAGETQIEGLTRELAEELDLTGVPIGRFLVLDQVPAARYGRAMVVTVFHVGPLTDQQTQSLRFADGEIGAAEFLPVEEALARLPHRLARRIQAAHAALLTGVPAVLIDGKSHVLSSSAVSEAW
ncbi:8-oxo-dGTP diphosphatase [Streptomyces sp. B3I7]|uniref:NUDIX domain-containing protein n=1 Tax=Streptomyces sp. B3I7 TaxID=3042269 RepID=UPI002782BB63|nr:NUDIX hydrolase [Streptomyces sp. B3I7]MDQ0810170.1 8-oxo-dGTP diphosphatase [Streptomyces sp. B3I7]